MPTLGVSGMPPGGHYLLLTERVAVRPIRYWPDAIRFYMVSYHIGILALLDECIGKGFFCTGFMQYHET